MNWNTLFAGDVLIDVIHRADGVAGLRSVFTVAASRERIWSVLLDYDNFPHIFQGIKRVKVLESDNQGARLEYWIDAVLSTYHYVALRQYPEPGRKVTWKRLSGDFKRLEGSWEIQETPRLGVHMLVYESYVEVDTIIPESWIRAEAIRRTRETNEQLRRWIEQRPILDTTSSETHSSEVPGTGH
ncbi:MAG: SRPBCC family protein [Candidatus Tectimicrobiota bacterium]